MKLDDIEFIKLLPYFMQEDETDVGLSKGMSKIISAVFSNAKTLRVWDQFSSLNEKQCDELAYELDVDWYNQEGMTLDEKRDVLEKAISIKKKRGTKWAVEELLTSYFGSGEVMEWPEFDGQPFTFYALTENEQMDEESFQKFVNAVQNAKNERSRLAGIMFFLKIGKEEEGTQILITCDDKSHKYDFRLCGNIPKKATIGTLEKESIEVSPGDEPHEYGFEKTGKLKSGIKPKTGTLGLISSENIAVKPSLNDYDYSFIQSGSKKCDFSVGTLDKEKIVESCDEVPFNYMFKKICSGSTGTTVSAGLTNEGNFSSFFYSFKSCSESTICSQ